MWTSPLHRENRVDGAVSGGGGREAGDFHPLGLAGQSHRPSTHGKECDFWVNRVNDNERFFVLSSTTFYVVSADLLPGTRRAARCRLSRHHLWATGYVLEVEGKVQTSHTQVRGVYIYEKEGARMSWPAYPGEKELWSQNSPPPSRYHMGT